MQFDWKQYLAAAQYLAVEQKSNSPTQYEQGLYRSAVSRSYYAAYWTAKHYLINKLKISLLAKGAREHGAVISSLKNLEPKQGETLQELLSHRIKADYDDAMVVDKRGAEHAIKRAGEVINWVDSN